MVTVRFLFSASTALPGLSLDGRTGGKSPEPPPHATKITASTPQPSRLIIVLIPVSRAPRASCVSITIQHANRQGRFTHVATHREHLLELAEHIPGGGDGPFAHRMHDDALPRRGALGIRCHQKSIAFFGVTGGLAVARDMETEPQPRLPRP